MNKRDKLINILIKLSHTNAIDYEDFNALYSVTLYLLYNNMAITKNSKIIDFLYNSGFAVKKYGEHYYIFDYDEEAKNKLEKTEKRGE